MIQTNKNIVDFFIKYKKEVNVFLGALIFAIAADAMYGGVDGAAESVIGVLLEGSSTFFFTVFTLMVLFRVVVGFFRSSLFSNWSQSLNYNPKPLKGEKK